MSQELSTKAVPLRDFWLSLSTNPQERARLMTDICREADISYEHLKHVINRRRGLSVDAMYRLVEASGDRIDITDLMQIARAAAC